MAVLTGVRDRLRAELGAEPATWAVIERVLDIVQVRLVELGLERGDGEPGAPGLVGRPIAPRSLAQSCHASNGRPGRLPPPGITTAPTLSAWKTRKVVSAK